VRTGREHLGQHRDLQTSLGKLQRGTHPGTAGADYHHIKCSFRNCHNYSQSLKIVFRDEAQGAAQRMTRHIELIDEE
jgi:hypothetical protein